MSITDSVVMRGVCCAAIRDECVFHLLVNMLNSGGKVTSGICWGLKLGCEHGSSPAGL